MSVVMGLQGRMVVTEKMTKSGKKRKGVESVIGQSGQSGRGSSCRGEMKVTVDDWGRKKAWKYRSRRNAGGCCVATLLQLEEGTDEVGVTGFQSNSEPL